MKYAIVKDITPNRATVTILADSRNDLVLTHDELVEMGLDDIVQIVQVSDDVAVGDRVRI